MGRPFCVTRGPKIFREVEIVPGCAVVVACPFMSLIIFLSHLGTGRVIRNMLGWSLQEETARSGVWLFRGALQGRIFVLPLPSLEDWERKGSYHTAWVPCDSSCTRSHANGHGPAVGPHTEEQCWPLLAGVWRAIPPLMKQWCAEGEVPTAASLNLSRGWKSCVGWHCDDEPSVWKVW